MPQSDSFFHTPKTKNSKQSYSSFLTPSFFLMTMIAFGSWATFFIIKGSQKMAELESAKAENDWHNLPQQWYCPSQGKLLSCDGILNATGFGYLTLERFLGACSELNRHDSLKTAGEYASSIFSKVPEECLQTLSNLCANNHTAESEGLTNARTMAFGLGLMMMFMLFLRLNVKTGPANNNANNETRNDQSKFQL